MRLKQIKELAGDIIRNSLSYDEVFLDTETLTAVLEFVKEATDYTKYRRAEDIVSEELRANECRGYIGNDFSYIFTEHKTVSVSSKSVISTYEPVLKIYKKRDRHGEYVALEEPTYLKLKICDLEKLIKELETVIDEQ